jgi:hypothetical protein
MHWSIIVFSFFLIIWYKQNHKIINTKIYIVNIIPDSLDNIQNGMQYLMLGETIEFVDTLTNKKYTSWRHKRYNKEQYKIGEFYLVEFKINPLFNIFKRKVLETNNLIQK